MNILHIITNVLLTVVLAVIWLFWLGFGGDLIDWLMDGRTPNENVGFVIGSLITLGMLACSGLLIAVQRGLAL